MSPEVSLDAGLASLRGRAVVADLTGRGTLVVSGPDCAELLHGLVTNDVKRLRPGSGCHAALLTPKGRMRADLVLLRTADDELVLDCDPSLAASLHAILSGYVPFSRSTLEDRTSASGVVHLEGPASAGILGDSGCSRPPDEPFSHLATDLAGGPVRVVRISRAGEEGFDVRVDRAEAGKVLGLLSTGARPVPPELLDGGRVEAGIPRWGSELDETVLPNEAWLERTAIS
jgi:glycine cleavage system aminomethyltransferase T